jgi:hypothetical protein
MRQMIPSYFLFSHSSIVVSVPLFERDSQSLSNQSIETYLAANVEIRLVLVRALEHPAIILYEIKVNRSLARRPFRVLQQRLHSISTQFE